ncbi:hypothetical protein BDQ17DRAFT_1425050 [Cyathus striatus]|nr:hypothetical protein BDQ17DRAFT_1425050 [Cyathus striatus]
MTAEQSESAGDLHKSSAHLLENLLDPRTSRSEEANHTPFNRAFDVDIPLFEWYNQSEQRLRLHQFMTAMQGMDELQKDDGITTALNAREYVL